MNTSYFTLPLLLFSHTLLAESAPLLAPDWEIIPVATEMMITDSDGTSRAIQPACAFDTIPGTEIPNAFHFYYKAGDSQKLLVYFNGGGTCWDDATCVSSLSLQGIPGARPTYNPTVHAANDPTVAGGILDDTNTENPFQTWSKVFIPYCSGDLHSGSNEVTYSDIDGSVTGVEGAPMLFKHHGFDNFLAVNEWLKNHYAKNNDDKTAKLKNLVISGSSAGGYGATFNFPYLQANFPKTDAVLIADASAAIVSQGFLDNVLINGKSTTGSDAGSPWNIEATLVPMFAEQLDSFSIAAFNEEIFTPLIAAYPEGRFAQYTTQFDEVQVQFLKIMQSIENDITNPLLWGLTTEDADLFGAWNMQMESSLGILAKANDNYQYYIGEGSIHMVLIDAFAPEGTQLFYDEQSAEGVKFSDWINRLVNDKQFTTENLKHSPMAPLAAELSFTEIPTSYSAGDMLRVSLIETIERTQALDLWAAILLADGTFLYITETGFSLMPTAFMLNVPTEQVSHHLLQVEIPEGLTGNFSFFALFNEAGAGIDDLEHSIRSNIAQVSVELVE